MMNGIAPATYRLIGADEEPRSRQFEVGDSADSLAKHETKTLIGRSRAVHEIVAHVRLFSRSCAPILITGKSGTGKEVVARMIHDLSQRSQQKYVRVNCAALSESLIESELFGHDKGAFTGATDERVGRFEWAESGTLLLDEISEIPSSLQAKLLRVLEEEEFQRVGSNQSRPMKARIIATSNRCLLQEVAAGRFREDLFYRLNVLQLDLPPLRERADDIPLLIEFFVRRFRHEGMGTTERVHPSAMKHLCRYDWPGNVRQLRNTVHRLCILSQQSVIHKQDLPEFLSRRDTGGNEADLYEMTLRDAERLLIKSSLSRCAGNRTAAAERLGVTPRTLHNRLRQDPSLLLDD